MIREFLGYYQPLLKEKYDDFNKRLNDLDSLERIASRYDSLEEFLSDMALEPPERSIIEAGSKDKDDSVLTLSTIHSAKGLEWHTVFLIYAAEGHLPSYLSLENEEAIEEELRLFYVACTRAKINLFLLKPHIDRSPRSFLDEGASVFTQVSRFLTQGDVLHTFTRIESAGASDILEDVDIKDIIDGDSRPNSELLERMREYFRDNQE
jgi:DNA helicase-2/ATP-dependent DNA helicase PcrA